MRILQIDRQRQWAGQQVRTWALSKRLIERGDHVVYACQPASGFERRAAEAGIPFHAFGMRGAGQLAAAVVRLARILKRERIEVVDAHGSVDHNLAVFASRLLGRAVIVRTKHNHTRLHSAASRVIYGRFTRRIIALSGFVRDLLVSMGLDPARIDMIPEALDVDAITTAARAVDRAAARQRFGIPEGAFAVGTTSRPSPRKGIDVAAKAVARLAAAEGAGARPIVYVAAGAPREGMAWAVQAGLAESRLLTPGFLERVTDLLPALDVFLLPSREEALGMALLEALAVGVPSIGTATGGVPEIVRDGETGLLVPPGDDEALARAIARLRDDADLARRCGEAGAALVRRTHDLGAQVAATRACYERALA